MRILTAASRLFDRYGPLKTTIADIARESGMSPANIYNFFKSRDEVIEAVGEIYFADFRRKIVRDLSQAKGSWDSICHLFIEHARQARHHLANEKDFLHLQLLARENEWQFVGRFHEFLIDRLEHLIREGVCTGEFGAVDPVATASAIFNCMVSAVDPALILKQDPEQLENQIHAQLRLLKQALR